MASDTAGKEVTDWKARAAAVTAADGEEWDRLHDALETDWTNDYRAAFRLVALARGWSEEDIASGWLDDLPAQAFVSVGWDTAPEVAAAGDVIECEIEAANA